jgi:hypothetical protein
MLCRSLSVLFLVITKLPNTEQSSKGKGKTHKSINRENQSTTGKLRNRNGPDLVQAFPKKWWVESDFTAPNLPLPLRLKGVFGNFVITLIMHMSAHSHSLPQHIYC